MGASGRSACEWEAAEARPPRAFGDATRRQGARRLGRHVVSVAICHKGELPPVLGTEAPESVQVCDGTVEEEEKGGRDRRDVVCIFCVCI